LNFSSAYLLVSHGSRDSRPQVAVEHLAKLVRQRLQGLRLRREGQLVSMGTLGSWQGEEHKIPLVNTAVLELASLPLHKQIQQFAKQAIAAGYKRIKILPLFLLPGVHVMEDIPAEVAIAQQNVGNQIGLELRPHVGSHAELWQLLLDPIDAGAPQVGKVLIAHGSRRPNSHRPVEAVAARLNALPAYWSTDPGLEEQVTELIKQGYQQIKILPYFLFEGGITDAIDQAVNHLSQQFPYAQIHLARPIGATGKLADYVVELIV
jgi:sirohydrochlorin cobaltochelatase